MVVGSAGHLDIAVVADTQRDRLEGVRASLVGAGHQGDFLANLEPPQIDQAASRLDCAIRLHAVDALASQDGHQGIARVHRDSCGGRRQRLRHIGPRAGRRSVGRGSNDRTLLRACRGHRARLGGRLRRLIRDSAGETPLLFPLHPDAAVSRQFDVEPSDARLEAGHRPLYDPNRDTGGEAARVEHAAQALHQGICLGPAHIDIEEHIHQGAARAQGALQLKQFGLDRVLRALVGRGAHGRLIGVRRIGRYEIDLRILGRRLHGRLWSVFLSGCGSGGKRQGTKF